MGQLPPVDMSSKSSTPDADTPLSPAPKSPSPPGGKFVVTKVYGSKKFTASEIAKLKERGFVGAVDQGTTSTRFIIFSVEGGDPIVSAQLEITNFHPKPG